MIGLIDYEDFKWPDGRLPPDIVRLARGLRRRLKRIGLHLVEDRTRFTDPHYRGGYMVVSDDRILAGKDFELSINDVMMITERAEKQTKNRAG